MPNGAPPQVPTTLRLDYTSGMPKFLNRNAVLPIPCPKCGHEIKETLAGLEKNPDLTCPSCGTSFAVNADDFKRGLERADKLVSDFKARIPRSLK
jgi:hypothetical protein